ncbi:MAG TPA: hypothetical protein VJW20_07270 [Candidatus Angelobacter sp.]|nr:hypothetical protein [Candidatus Angelobacter sp.]
MTFSIDRFLQTFLRPPSGTSPQDIYAKIRHHIDVANNPAQYSSDTSVLALRVKRRNARQAVRRLVLKHPEIAEQLMRDLKNGSAQ